MFYFPPLLDPPPLLDLDDPLLELPDDDLLGLILPLELLLLDDPESQLLLDDPESLLLGDEDLGSYDDLLGVVDLDGDVCLVSELGLLLLSDGCVLVFGLVLFTSLFGVLVVDSDLL